jgi:glutathione synthase
MHTTKVLIIADRLIELKIPTDTSIALAQGAHDAGQQVYFCESKDISYKGSHILIQQCHQVWFSAEHQFKYNVQPIKNLPFSDFDMCFIRKDPPFDEEYKDLCWILNTQTQVKIVNPPHTLLSYHEKSLHLKALSLGILPSQNHIPTCVSQDLEIIESFCQEAKDTMTHGIICKPWLGHGGEGVMLFQKKEELLLFLKKNAENSPAPIKFIIQPYLPEIKTAGDRRVLICAGKIMGHFVRLPPQGGIAANLAQGGHAVLREMTSTQTELCQNIGRFLKEEGIIFAGLDLIGDYLSEINITSPTGLRTYETLTNQKHTSLFFKEIEQFLGIFPEM